MVCGDNETAAAVFGCLKHGFSFSHGNIGELVFEGSGLVWSLVGVTCNDFKWNPDVFQCSFAIFGARGENDAGKILCDFGEGLDEIFWFVIEDYFCSDIGHGGRDIATGFGDDVDGLTDRIAVAAIHAETNAFFAELDNIAIALPHGGKSIVTHEGFTFRDFSFAPFFDVASHESNFDASLV